LRICSVKDKPILPLLQKENVARSEDARKPSGPQAARVSQMIPVPKKSCDLLCGGSLVKCRFPRSEVTGPGFAEGGTR
jgi:hypothetical protein